MTHPIPCPESLPTPSHMYIPSVKTKPSLCSINDHFSKQKLFVLYIKIHWTVPDINLRFPSSLCLCICGPQISGFTPQDAARLSDIFNGLSPPMIMTNLNIGSFTLGGGDLPQLAMPNTHIFHFQNRATNFGRCPMLLSPPSNTKHSVDQPYTHDIPSNTKHSVDLYHALTPMSCDILVSEQKIGFFGRFIS